MCVHMCIWPMQIIFGMVLVLVCLGMTFSGIQFYNGEHPAPHPSHSLSLSLCVRRSGCLAVFPSDSITAPLTLNIHHDFMCAMCVSCAYMSSHACIYPATLVCVSGLHSSAIPLR